MDIKYFHWHILRLFSKIQRIGAIHRGFSRQCAGASQIGRRLSVFASAAVRPRSQSRAASSRARARRSRRREKSRGQAHKPRRSKGRKDFSGPYPQVEVVVIVISFRDLFELKHSDS
ncbi:hypothetical protein [Pseudorhodobacter sp.]|uniref:hypothetical protein n=1 Tax=Pseudorhodobacter sp. TaxID=1934400 RepID=UPI002647428F|nr:hypothetical protein [Pseudorhodobacter sp.]MDN5787089.1 hypothetical protein [Pseudorhodobacter sp.]